jgi:hypothetical protein
MGSQRERTQLRHATDPGAVVDKIRQAPGGQTAEFDARSSNFVITQSRHPADQAFYKVEVSIP